MADELYVRVKKTCVGAISFTLVNPATGVKQVVTIPANGGDKLIPLSWAALLYQDTSSGAYCMYKNGYFIFDDPNKVFNYAKEHGLILGDADVMKQLVTESYMADIKKALIDGNTKAIQEYIDKGDKFKQDVARVAHACADKLTAGFIKYLEGKLGVAIVESEE